MKDHQYCLEIDGADNSNAKSSRVCDLIRQYLDRGGWLQTCSSWLRGLCSNICCNALGCIRKVTGCHCHVRGCETHRCASG